MCVCDVLQVSGCERLHTAGVCRPVFWADLGPSFLVDFESLLFPRLLKACFFRGFCKPHFSRRLQSLYFPIECEPSFSRRFPTPAFPRSLHRTYWGDDPGHLHLPANLHHAPL